ncbi:MAG: hypothetical protein HOP12_06965, partial [Candidatus Eisenbacteria bacterium]|nr:hypothetical protein [Candidatus Eisenbacteria bacterium]
VAVVLEGDARARLGPARAGEPAWQLETREGARIRSNDGPAEVRVSARSRGRATVQVLDGSAQVRNASGSVTVREGQYVVSDSIGALSAPQPLPPSPTLQSPGDGIVMTTRRSRDDVSFAWEPVPGARGYRIEIARDWGFRELIYEAVLNDTRLRYPNLPRGAYHWRVSAIAREAESAYSVAADFELRADATPPRLEVLQPNGAVMARQFRVRGSSEPGTQVRVSGERVAVGIDGSFERDVVLETGVNMIVVEALDEVGNVAYRTLHVTAKVEAP